MVATHGKTPARKVRGLQTKGLTGKQAKTVKGGVIAIISSPKPVQTEFLPYIEQDNFKGGKR